MTFDLHFARHLDRWRGFDSDEQSDLHVPICAEQTDALHSFRGAAWPVAESQSIRSERPHIVDARIVLLRSEPKVRFALARCQREMACQLLRSRATLRTMGDTYEGIDAPLATFLTAQRIFFVATAPLAADGHVNLSPKGLDTFRVLDRHAVAYLDLTGSGIETVAHLRENGRIVFCFCAFEGPPRIVRLHGHGTVLEPTDAQFVTLRPLFPPFDGVRAIVRVELQRIATSCGYAVPLMRFEGNRRQLAAWTAAKGPAGVAGYQAMRNRRSLDDLPGLKLGRD